MKKNITNFGRTWNFNPKQITFPASVEELKHLIKTNASLRPMGSKHSWSKGIVTKDTLVSLKRFNKIITIDFEKLQVTTGAGITLKSLIFQLEKKGLR